MIQRDVSPHNLNKKEDNEVHEGQRIWNSCIGVFLLVFIILEFFFIFPAKEQNSLADENFASQGNSEQQQQQ